MSGIRVLCGAAMLAVLGLAGATPYPPARTVDHVDEYFGVPVADPYRWLEDVDSEETRAWVRAQNQLTQATLAEIDAREPLRERMTELWSYARRSVPEQVAGRYFYTRNNGLQNQDVLVMQSSADAEPELLLDPNSLSEDGTVALTTTKVSPDGKYLGYGLSVAGSDWNEFRVRRIADGKDLPDTLGRIKFSGMSWTKDSGGFFYSRYPEPPANDDEGVFEALANQRLYYHRVGTSQDLDRLVAEAPGEPKWGFAAQVTDDGRYNVISIWRGTENANDVWVQDLQDPKNPRISASTTQLITGFKASYVLVGSQGSELYFRTDLGAPRGRIIAIDLNKPGRGHWRSVVPQSTDVLKHAVHAADQLVLVYMQDASERIRRYTLAGQRLADIELPGLGRLGTYRSDTASNISGSPGDDELFFAYSDFSQPLTVYRASLSRGRHETWFAPKLKFNPDDYVTEQVFFSSRDGTRVPMFISYKKGLKRNGDNRTLLHAYGGFDVSLTPWYSVPYFSWMDAGGVFAVANIRGGGEYGADWHRAGTQLNKTNVFDDFIAAAGYLIHNDYTRSARLAITGRSNGGLLMGAVTNRAPWLYSAVVADVGVMDMLRFHKFTIGWAWTGDYGSSDNQAQFHSLLSYSPYHNVQRQPYPAVLVTTGDHDDRVVPGHSYKYTAAMQAMQIGQDPILIRVDTAAGHAAGKPIDKQIEEEVDRISFMLRYTDGLSHLHRP